VWARVDLNNAPLLREKAYDWVTETVITQLRELNPQIDFDSLTTIEKVFSTEITAFKKGPISLLKSSDDAYKVRLVDWLNELQSDRLVLANAMARFLCAGPGKLLVIALDNCDKRTREDQLLMFQVAQWIQREFRALVILPLRDVTYDMHRSEPPLDTTLKGLTFRIEPPPFAEVLQKRVMLALEEMDRGGSGPERRAAVV
jgi:hypothetical protein